MDEVWDEARMARLRQRFRARLEERLATMEAALSAVSGPAPEDALRELLRNAHSLAGAAASFGMPALGEAAARLERDVEEALRDGCAFRPGGTARAAALIADLRDQATAER